MNLGEAKIAVGQNLVEFASPPVVETALGVRFAPIDKFSAVHFGQLLDVYRGSYDRFELKPPVGAVLHVNIDPQAASFNIPLRCWYINSDDTQVIQVQNDLFIRNWRATAERAEYQHYDAIKPLFKRDWQQFCAFLDRRGLKRPSVWQCEVTYINHLVRGREWRTFEDIAALFPVWNGIEVGGVLEAMEMAGFSVGFKLHGSNGHIQFTMQPAVRQDGSEILQLAVNAVGKPKDNSDEAILGWLDFGHLAVINGFVQFTSKRAQQIWGRK